MAEKHDVIVVGGGMVGATLACALADGGLRVAVVEPHAASRQWPEHEYDIRVSAITRATQNVFDHLGAWQGMVARRVSPYRRMQVWDAGGSGRIHFDSADVGEPDLGHIVENRVILAALLDRLDTLERVQYLCPARPGELTVDADSARLTLEDGHTLSAPLLVGADGSSSWVRGRVGIDTVGWSYDQVAVVATVKTSRHHGAEAYQRFLPEGPLAFLPLPEGLSSIVWSTSPARAEALMALDEAAFLDELQLAFGDVLGRMEWVGPRGAFPLALQHAREYVRPRVALVGNAAHTIHPLAGQGLNLGVSDAAALAETVLHARAARRDLGAYRELRRYERWRKADNVLTMGAMDGFKRLFGTDAAPVRWARSLGLGLADHAGPVKAMMVRRAMGLVGDLPALTRPPR